MKERGSRRSVEGTVTSAAMNKSIVVRAERLQEHPRYRKFIKQTTIYKAHDENNEAKLGAKVRIVESRPLSKTKHWRLAEIIEQGAEER